jgi:hypothetical protein
MNNASGAPTSPTSPTGASTLSSIASLPGINPDLASKLNDKDKGAPSNLAMVPTATSGFYSPLDNTGKSQLLQSMMQRSRGGGM